MSKLIREAITRFSKFKQTPLSIQQLTLAAQGGRLRSIQFLKNELPIRLAHMAKEIDSLPGPLLKLPSVKEVEKMYFDSFEDIINCSPQQPNETEEDYAKRFTEVLRNILYRHRSVVPLMALGILELKKSPDYNERLDFPIQYFLNRLYMNRISIRMIIQQFIQVFSNGGDLFHPNCDVIQVAKEAAESAQHLCYRKYMVTPEIKISGYPTFKSTHVDCCIPYIPTHLYHMLFELLKNSLRAVVEFHGETAKDYPPITVDVYKAKEDLTIKISDQGGGIPRNDLPKLFNYLFTTAVPPEEIPRTSMNEAPMAGLGYGLPITRLYARYFGGDLKIASIEGIGTDAYLYLKASSDKAAEFLPEHNLVSMKRYQDSRLLMKDGAIARLRKGLDGEIVAKASD